MSGCFNFFAVLSSCSTLYEQILLTLERVVGVLLSPVPEGTVLGKKLWVPELFGYPRGRYMWYRPRLPVIPERGLAILRVNDVTSTRFVLGFSYLSNGANTTSCH